MTIMHRPRQHPARLRRYPAQDLLKGHVYRVVNLVMLVRTVHIESADLESFMLSLEGTSAYRAWMSGGFSDLQVQQLYGTQVLQAFLAHKLVSGDVA